MSFRNRTVSDLVLFVPRFRESAGTLKLIRPSVLLFKEGQYSEHENEATKGLNILLDNQET